jgi:hypothetical protein
MRDPTRIPKVLATLEKIWRDDPDARLGQLVVAATNLSGRQVVCPEVFYVEDDEMLRGLEELARRKQNEQC